MKSVNSGKIIIKKLTSLFKNKKLKERMSRNRIEFERKIVNQ